jgi:hypothetical protein
MHTSIAFAGVAPTSPGGSGWGVRFEAAPRLAQPVAASTNRAKTKTSGLCMVFSVINLLDTVESDQAWPLKLAST